MKPLDGKHLSAILAAARSRQPKAAELLGAYVDDLLEELESRRGTKPESDFRARMDAFLARHPAKPLPVPASPTPPPAPYQDPDDDTEAA